MKSYFLEAIIDADQTRGILTELLPSQTEPWVLQSLDGHDAVAYFNVCSDEEPDVDGPFYVQADVSGRHYNRDQSVILLLRSLQLKTGGIVKDEEGRAL